MFAAFAASLCCILPLVFVVLGVGAVGTAAIFETARPFLLDAAALLLVFGFYRAYFRREESCDPGKKCAAKPINRASRVSLWLALIAVVAFALAPYYTGIIARNLMKPSTQASAVTADSPATIAQARFKIMGMTCGGCANTIKAALEKTAGVRHAEVSYERGEAIVDYDTKVITPKKIRDIINQTGFKAEIISNNSENQSTTKSGGQLTFTTGSEKAVLY